MTQQQTNTPPVKEFRAGRVRASVWRAEVERDGQTVVQHSVKIQNSYRDRTTQEWKTTDYFYPRDLPKLILVAQKAFEYVSLRESEDAPDPPTVEG